MGFASKYFDFHHRSPGCSRVRVAIARLHMWLCRGPEDQSAASAEGDYGTYRKRWSQVVSKSVRMHSIGQFDKHDE